MQPRQECVSVCSHAMHSKYSTGRHITQWQCAMEQSKVIHLLWMVTVLCFRIIQISSHVPCVLAWIFSYTHKFQISGFWGLNVLAISSQGVNSVTVRGDSLWQLSMMLYEKGYRFFTSGQWFFTSFYAHAKRGVKMVIFDSFRVKFC